MIKDKLGIQRYSVSTKLYKILRRIREKIRHDDQEYWIAYGGDTGSGKSLRAQRDAFVINKNLNISHVCYDRTEFIKAVLDAKKGEVIIADEGISIFFSRASMSKEGKIIAELSAQIRQKNLCIMLCMPNVVAMDFLIQEKIDCLAWVSEGRFNRNGRLQTMKGITDYYFETPQCPSVTNFIKYKKSLKTNPNKPARKPDPLFREAGSPISKKEVWYPVNEKLYKDKKESVLKKYIEDKKEKGPGKTGNKHLDKALLQRNKLIVAYRKQGLSFKQMEKLSGVPKSTLILGFQSVNQPTQG